MTDGGRSELVERLLALARLHRLRAAHRSEFIPDGVSAPREVEAALDAAVAEGIAIGLALAADLVDGRRS